jgi:hypothetical protein
MAGVAKFKCYHKFQRRQVIQQPEAAWLVNSPIFLSGNLYRLVLTFVRLCSSFSVILKV